MSESKLQTSGRVGQKEWEGVAVVIARSVLGGIFLLFGIDEIANFLPSSELNPAAMNFMEALKDTGYLYTSVKVIEVACGVLLLSGLLVPLVNLILAPIIFNIVLFGIFLDPGLIYVNIVQLFCHLFIFWFYRKLYKKIVLWNLQIDPNSTRVSENLPDEE